MIRFDRLLWVGPLTVLTALAAVLLVRVMAVALLHPNPTFQPLWWPPPIIDTVVLVTAAVVVFSQIANFFSNPVRAFRIIALLVLLVSFWPVVAIVRSHWQGATWPDALALMAMHVTAWAVTVTMLTRLAITRADIHANNSQRNDSH